MGNIPEIWQSVQDLHLHLHWWTCCHCHLEERWECDNSQCYLPADQEDSWSCLGYIPDGAHHWPISKSEWHCWVIQLHSGECQGKIIKDSAYTWQRWVNPMCMTIGYAICTVLLWNSTHSRMSTHSWKRPIPTVYLYFFRPEQAKFKWSGHALFSISYPHCSAGLPNLWTIPRTICCC